MYSKAKVFLHLLDWVLYLEKIDRKQKKDGFEIL
jgi:hypothetical protein